MTFAPSLARWEGVQKTDRIGQTPWGGGGGSSAAEMESSRWVCPGNRVATRAEPK